MKLDFLQLSRFPFRAQFQMKSKFPKPIVNRFRSCSVKSFMQPQVRCWTMHFALGSFPCSRYKTEVYNMSLPVAYMFLVVGLVFKHYSFPAMFSTTLDPSRHEVKMDQH